MRKGDAIEEGKITCFVLLEGMGGNEGGRPAADVEDDEYVTMM